VLYCCNAAQWYEQLCSLVDWIELGLVLSRTSASVSSVLMVLYVYSTSFGYILYFTFNPLMVQGIIVHIE